MMKHIRSLAVFLLVFMGVTKTLYGDFANTTRDFPILSNYIYSKRTIPLAEKWDKFLKIYGDVKLEYKYKHEEGIDPNTKQYRAYQQYGEFDVDFDLKIDYKCDKTWAYIYIQSDNAFGIIDHVDPEKDPKGCLGSGFCNDICVKEVYIGRHLIDLDDFFVDVEVGRRRLYRLFDSRIQFASRCDGINFKIAKELNNDHTKIYFRPTVFVVDERSNYLAYAFETGVLNLQQTGLDLKYSFIDWRQTKENISGIANPLGWNFQISQFTFGYKISDLFRCLNVEEAKLYGAFLVNHVAKGNKNTNYKKANLGWYLGFIIGEVENQYDWSLDVNYQYVQAQAIPECDKFGIGRGNKLKRTFTVDGEGNTNYQGLHTEFLYALTKCIYIDVTYRWSIPANRSIGGYHSYREFEIDLIHKF